MPEKNGLSALTINDFSGGLTDNVLGGATNKYEVADNLNLGEDGDLDVRAGTNPKYDTRSDSEYFISSIIDHDGEILLQAGPRVKHDSNANIRGPNNHNVFSRGNNTSKMDFAFWKGHTIAASDEFTSIQRIYKNQNGLFTVENLGLPELIYGSSIALANSLKSNFNAHLSDVTEHTSGADTDNVVTAPDADDLTTLIALTNELIDAYRAHEEDAQQDSDWNYHAGKEASDHSLGVQEAVTTLFGAFTALKEIKSKFNAHDADASAHAANSLHQESFNADVQISKSGSGNNYLYGLHFTRRYFVEDRQFTERGRVYLTSVEDVDAPDTTPITLSSIPVLVSGPSENWRDSEIKISIFRTTNNGSTLFFVGEINNGETTFEDSMSDADLVNQETAYTEGGVLDNDLPPKAKFINIVNNTLVLSHVKIGSTIYGDRTYFSKTGEISGVPSDSFVEWEKDTTGQGWVGIYPIVFLEDRCYRVEGSQDSRGVGSVQKRSISQRVGTRSPKSVVSTESGVFFAGEDGFYFTDGYSARLISTDREESYKRLLNKENIEGCYDKKNNRVLFSVQTDVNSPTNDTIWVAHLDYLTEERGHPFTTWSGGLDRENFTASSLAYIEGVIYKGDSRGYLLYFDEEELSDTYLDTFKLPQDWHKQTIHYDFRSVAYDFGNERVRKWVPKFNINCDNVTSLHMAIYGNNDNSGVFSPLGPITSKNNITWGDRSILWAEAGVLWNYSPVICEWRYFPTIGGASIRCMYKQIRLTNAYVTIDTSEAIGGVTIDSQNKTVTLDSYPTHDWVNKVVNYFIYFETDGYTKEFRITDVNDGVLTVDDPNGALQDGSDVQWKIMGYKKDEKLKLLNYVFSFRELTMSQRTYRPMEAS